MIDGLRHAKRRSQAGFSNSSDTSLLSCRTRHSRQSGRRKPEDARPKRPLALGARNLYGAGIATVTGSASQAMSSKTETIAALIDSATAVFSETGYEGASLREGLVELGNSRAVKPGEIRASQRRCRRCVSARKIATWSRRH